MDRPGACIPYRPPCARRALRSRLIWRSDRSESDGEEARSEDDADYALPEPRKHGILKRPSTGDEAPHAEASWLLCAPFC